ncbi:TetR/AcrR family transcriptional regulator [Salinibacterium hongtaonis]|uniref:TetR/AcrR family transcriptional regulator n=1 Tax=Homoserinimonas hongtaonis TaxID=2079791 RepID=UPI000D3740EF|nr:TetR/AcrR family transcriptional regulator [Salinibacterium hongtaonis]AWB88896.1 TetR/AcrR family transcriptional regulator [Salinibacterium hongtaonis]
MSIHEDRSAELPIFAPGPGARSRILATASRLFYYEGIRAVGIDRLISESSVTKATFYKHFGAKDALILAYMQLVHVDTVESITAIQSSAGSPVDTLRGLIDEIRQRADRADFRGCAFMNASVEFPDSGHPVRSIVNIHRDWYSEFVAEQFRLAGHPLAGDAADEFVMLRDGAMVGGYMGDRIATTAALSRLGERLLAA